MGIISFDFDGVLHTSVIEGTTHPINYDEPETWEPFKEVFKLIHEEAKSHRVVVVSKRDDWMAEYIWEFIQMHNLPIEDVYCTNCRQKPEYLLGIGADKHYDDHDELIDELKGTGIIFILVNPFKKTFKTYLND